MKFIIGGRYNIKVYDEQDRSHKGLPYTQNTNFINGNTTILVNNGILQTSFNINALTTPFYITAVSFPVIYSSGVSFLDTDKQGFTISLFDDSTQEDFIIQKSFFYPKIRAGTFGEWYQYLHFPPRRINSALTFFFHNFTGASISFANDFLTIHATQPE